MNLERLFEDIEVLEAEIKKKWPKQKGRVIIANIKTEVDYELGKPEGDMENLKWANEYKSKLKEHISL